MSVTFDATAPADERGQGERYNDGDGGLDGFNRVQRASATGRWGSVADPLHESRVASAAELIADMLNGRAPSWALKEALMPSDPSTAQAIERNYPGLMRVQEAYSTSDFPLLMGDVLDRMLLGRFREFPQGWRRYTRVSRPLRDFRTVRRLKLDGAEGRYTEQTEETGLTYDTTLAEVGYTYSPALFSKGVKLSFRAIMNDDLNAFDSIPDRLGRGGRRSIAYFVTDLLFDANGPDATFFSSGNGNLLSGNPDLAIDSLGTAFEQLLGFTDANSEPILVEGVVLQYPPALHVTVQNLLNSLTVDVTTEGGVSNQTVRVNNWIVRNIEAVMDPYIPIIATSNPNTPWVLHVRPDSARPALEVGFLAGFEEPQLFRKMSNTMRVGGGADQNAGDWDTMSQDFKGVLGYGGATLNPQGAVGSNGSNS